MTIEITEFRCPTCGHVLGEEQYSIACEEVNRIVTERVKQVVEINNVQHRKEMQEREAQHRKEMQERERRNAAEIQSIVQQTLSKERVSIDLRHQEDLAEKDRQIEAVRSEGDTYWEEKLDQAVAATVQGQAEKNSQFELKFHRVDERNRELMQDIEKLQRALDNVPSEFKGTSFENNVASQLRTAFKNDNIQEKEFGKEVADIVQTVVTDSGETISTPIVYDTKTADSVTPKDIEKAKKYKTIHNTDYCIIVTRKGIKPKDCEKEPSSLIGKREGIFLVHPSIVVGIARLMRNFMIENAKQTRINNGAESKYRRMYDYVTSPERFRKIEEKMLTKSKLDQLQKNEEEYHERKWKDWKNTIQNWYDADKDDQKKLVDIAGEDVDIDDTPP